jgi:bacterioferritin
MAKNFESDIKTLRARARKHIEDGAVTAGYSSPPRKVVKLLNEALATEIVCVLRYRRHHFMATGINAQTVAAEFLLHANEEQAHADLIAGRIVQLGGAPNFSPEGLLTRSHAEYVEGDDLVDMIKRGPRGRAHRHRQLPRDDRLPGHDDSTTRRMLEGILAMEEEHADDLVSLLEEFGKGK